jgi:hypothetical protein
MLGMTNKIYLYRMVHIDNMSHIFVYGITHKNSINANTAYKPIGDQSLIDTRNSKILPNGHKLSDCTPFYFHYRMPMLYVLQKGFNQVSPCPPSRIVYCITSVQKILEHGLPFNFTDGHAVAGLSNFYGTKEVKQIETEFLIKGDIPLAAILGFAVFDETAKNYLDSFASGKQTVIKSDYYF